MFKKKFTECLRAILPLVASCLCFNSASSATSAPYLFDFDSENLRLEWRLPGGIVGTEFPLVLPIARIANEGKYSIGFSHLGYSEQDPDGMAASLTITFRPVVPKSVSPSNSVGGVSFEFVAFQATELDISLMADTIEEKRIREALTLPRPIPHQMEVSIPFQIKWKGVDGAKLHSWLTKPDGLRWTLAGVAKLRLKVTTRERINSDCLKDWWERRVVSNPSKEVLLDPATVAVELLAHGCLETEVGSTTHRTVSAQYIGRIISGLQKYLEPASKYSSLTLEKIANASKPETSLHESVSQVQLRTIQIPGQFLIANPSYVKDLSGNSVGLDGLLGNQ